MKNLFFRVFLTCCLAFCCLPAVKAEDIPIRGQRREVFRVCPVDRETIVFLGNSITHFGTWPEFFGTDVKVVNRGISGNYSGEVADHLDLILSGKPKKLFVMIGINDHNQPNVIVPNIRRIIQTTRRESPETQVYIQSLLPCNRTDRHGMVEGKNEELKALCAEENVTYLDVYSQIVNKSTTPPSIQTQYTNDQLHVTGPGYRAWANYIASYVGSPSAFTNETAQAVGSFDTVENMLLTTFQLLPVPDGAMLHIGDYNVKTGEWAELMNNTKFLNRGLGLGWGYTHTIADLKLSVPHIVKGKPSKIFVQCGARDFADAATTAETAYTKYREVIEQIHNLAPEADIYMESIIPFTDATLNTKMKPFHDKLAAFAAESTTDKIHYIDVHAALSENGVLAEKYRGANTAQSKGINGRGYLRWANCLNEGSGNEMKPRPEFTDAQFQLNEALSEATRSKYNAVTGDAPGCYSEEAVNKLGEAVETARTLLYKEGATDTELTAAVETLNTALTKMGEGIVMPKSSNEQEAHWYTLSTPRRNNKFLTGEGIGSPAWGRDEAGTAAQQWKLVTRSDGAYDLVNRADETFLTPVIATGGQIQTVSAAPAKGWNLKGVGTTGMFILTNDKVQLHQTNASLQFKIINWGDGTNVTDDGCLFRFVDADEPVVPPVKQTMLTLTNIQLDGTKPYQIPKELAAPVLAASEVTVAIDFTLSQTPSNSCLVGASNSQSNDNFCAILASDAGHMAVRFNTGGGVYTRVAQIGTDRHQMVVTMKNVSPSYVYYLDGQSKGDIAALSTIFSTVTGVNGLYLGGIVTPSNANLYPAKGTIHSVQFFPGVMTGAEVSAISYDNLVPTAIAEVNSDEVMDDVRYYGIDGRTVGASKNLRPGLYIQKSRSGSRKILVQ